MAMTENKNSKMPKISNMYGRARRIAFLEKCIYIVVGIIAIVIIAYIITHTVGKADDNVNFAYLKQYMETKGYGCERIDLPGGKCSMYNEVSSHIFIRYDNGFEYLIKTKAYSLTMRHAPGNDSKINFKTTTSAFSGYKSKEYNCSYKGNILNEIGKCVEINDGSELDMDAYIGVINMAKDELNELVDMSGYNKKKLLEKYEWVK